MTTNKHDLDIDEILGYITASMVDESIMPHNKYEDAVTDEDIVILGQQLLDDVKIDIISLIESIGKELIGEDEDARPAKDIHIHTGALVNRPVENPPARVRNKLRATQREKLNTIIKRLK